MEAAFYESSAQLSQYLQFHFGAPDEVMPYDFGPKNGLDFLKRIAAYGSVPQQVRALDLGCAVGGLSFELARTYKEVIGIDYSQAFINAANLLKANGSLEYNYLEEGGLVTSAIANVASEIDRTGVSFFQGDAMNLSNSLGSFEIVFMINLIDRLSDPLKCLKNIANFINPGGALVIASPYTWLEEFTPKQNWLSNFSTSPTPTTMALTEILSSGFNLTRTTQEPFLIRETRRKFQWSVSEVTCWKKNSSPSASNG